MRLDSCALTIFAKTLNVADFDAVFTADGDWVVAAGAAGRSFVIHATKMKNCLKAFQKQAQTYKPSPQKRACPAVGCQLSRRSRFLVGYLLKMVATYVV